MATNLAARRGNGSAPLARPSQAASAAPACGLTQEQWQILKSSICRGFSDDEAAVFALRCQALKLSPFSGQITAFKQGGGVVPIISIDGYRAIAAEADPDYVVEREYFHDGQWSDTIPEEDASQARALVWRQGDESKRPIKFVVSRKELGGNGPTWRSMPNHMLGKVAESHALRVAYPQQLAGTYTSDEMDADQVSVKVETGFAGADPVRSQASQPATPAPVLKAAIIDAGQYATLTQAIARRLNAIGEAAMHREGCRALGIDSLESLPADQFDVVMSMLANADICRNWNQGSNSTGGALLSPEDVQHLSTAQAEAPEPAAAPKPVKRTIAKQDEPAPATDELEQADFL